MAGKGQQYSDPTNQDPRSPFNTHPVENGDSSRGQYLQPFISGQIGSGQIDPSSSGHFPAVAPITAQNLPSALRSDQISNLAQSNQDYQGYQEPGLVLSPSANVAPSPSQTGQFGAVGNNQEYLYAQSNPLQGQLAPSQSGAFNAVHGTDWRHHGASQDSIKFDALSPSQSGSFNAVGMPANSAMPGHSANQAHDPNSLNYAPDPTGPIGIGGATGNAIGGASSSLNANIDNNAPGNTSNMDMAGGPSMTGGLNQSYINQHIQSNQQFGSYGNAPQTNNYAQQVPSGMQGYVGSQGNVGPQGNVLQDLSQTSQAVPIAQPIQQTQQLNTPHPAQVAQPMQPMQTVQPAQVSQPMQHMQAQSIQHAQPIQQGQPIQQFQMDPSQSGHFQTVNTAIPADSGQFPAVQPVSQSELSGALGTQGSNERLPVIQLNQNPLNPLQERKSRGKSNTHKRLLIIGIIVFVIAIISLGVVLMMRFDVFSLFDEFTAAPPSENLVQSTFEEAALPEPDLSDFNYIEPDPLTEKSLGSYKINEVEYTGSGSSREALCEIGANSIWESKSLRVTEPLSMIMTYDKSTAKWNTGNIRSGSLTAKSLAPPNVDLILKNFHNILKTYDPEIAATYLNAEMTQESNLNNEGGSMVVTLRKNNAENQQVSCVANTDVSWSETTGWVVKVTSVTGDTNGVAPETPTIEKATGSVAIGSPAENSGQAASGNFWEFPDVPSGTLITGIKGTIQFSDTGKILLNTELPVKISIDGTEYTVNTIELVGSGHLSSGEVYTATGTITANGQLEGVPLVINISNNANI